MSKVSLAAGRKAVPMLLVSIEDPAALAGRVVVQRAEVATKPERKLKRRSTEIELRGSRIAVRGEVDRAQLRAVFIFFCRDDCAATGRAHLHCGGCDRHAQALR